MDRTTLHTESAKQRQKIFEGLGDTKTAVAQKSVKTKGDPQTTQGPMQKEGQQQSRPREAGKGEQRSEVNDSKKADIRPGNRGCFWLREGLGGHRLHS